MSDIPEDFLLSSYRYAAPETLIARRPPAERGASRLLVLERRGPRVTHSRFSSLARHLPAGALLVLNASKVTPARLFGRRATGGALEFLLLTPLPLLDVARDAESGLNRAEADGLLRGAKQCAEGETLAFGSLEATLLERGAFGKCRVRLVWRGELADLLAREGKTPLPPYLRRAAEPEDVTRYQTVYARTEGSAAAPTAGLHFTLPLLEELAQAGFGRAELDLHVGYGTFSPVRCGDIRRHRMHPEYVSLSRETAEAVRRARAEKRPVVAVGTTTARALEGCFAACGEIREFQGWTDIFLYPGARFQAIDGLITNFHLPESSLLMLVCAFAGRKAALDAYGQAVKNAYHLFSYGDAMLIV